MLKSFHYTFLNINRNIYQNRLYCYKTIKRPSLCDVNLKGDSKYNKSKNKTEISLTNQLSAKMKSTGPITVSEYMKEVLTNPNGGYYMKRDVFGREGDFITSPEITQIFGELIAIWCITEWRRITATFPLQIVEFGPGRGTLSQDFLRVFTHFGESRKISLHLVEVSPFLSKLQSQKLCFQSKEVEIDPKNGILHYREGESVSGVKVYWYQRIEDVPQKFSIYIAHEFFDALPIHKLQKVDNKWREILIDIDPLNTEKFRYIIAKDDTPITKLFKSHPNDTRDHIEYSLEIEKTIQHLSSRLECYGGFSLIIDYGHFGSKTDTFRSFRDHKLHDPLTEPGSSDLTADVDFQQLKMFAEKDDKLITFGPVNQGDFLKQMGGDFRLEILVENASPEQVDNIRMGYDMLTNPNKMGERFKIFAMFPSVLRKLYNQCTISGFTAS